MPVVDNVITFFNIHKMTKGHFGKKGFRASRGHTRKNDDRLVFPDILACPDIKGVDGTNSIVVDIHPDRRVKIAWKNIQDAPTKRIVAFFVDNVHALVAKAMNIGLKAFKSDCLASEIF
jgi:hypothetical protein